jgi:lantibiotic modifying enzyme
MDGPAASMPRIPYENDLPRLTDRLLAFIASTADVSRQDRVFPADPRVFATNGVGLAHGICGVLHAFVAADQRIDESYRTWLLCQTFDPDILSPGLFSGTAGAAAVLSEIGEHELALMTIQRSVKHRLASEDPFIYGGSSGIGLAVLWLYGREKRQVLLDDAVRLADAILASQLVADGRSVWHDANGDIPISLLYGSAGISVFLLFVWLTTGIEKYRRAGEAALDTALENHAIKDGSPHWTFPSYANKGARLLRHYWAEGSAGVGVALVRWIRATGNARYIDALEQVVPDTRRNMTIFPSLLMGMSGIGMFHLDLFYLLGRKAALDDCDHFARMIALYTVERPEGTGLPGEQLQRLSTDLATGAAGTALFYSHLLKARAGVARNDFGVAPLPDQLLESLKSQAGQCDRVAGSSS